MRPEKLAQLVAVAIKTVHAPLLARVASLEATLAELTKTNADLRERRAHLEGRQLGLEEAARRTGKNIAIIQFGLFPNAMIEGAFRNGAARYAPRVRAIFERRFSIERVADDYLEVYLSLCDIGRPLRRAGDLPLTA